MYLFQDFNEVTKAAVMEMDEYSETELADTNNKEAWEEAGRKIQAVWEAMLVDPAFKKQSVASILSLCLTVKQMEEAANDAGAEWEDFMKISFGD